MFKSITHLWLLLAALLLAACSTQQPETTPQPTVPFTQPSATAAVEVEAAATATPETPASPTPPVGRTWVLIGDSGLLTSQAAAVLETFASPPDLTIEISTTADPSAALAAALESGAELLIVVGPDLATATHSAAADHPDRAFIGLNLPPADLPNLTTIGGGVNDRHDQIGLITGMLAGFASSTTDVGAITPANTIIGRTYYNAFLFGLRLSCGTCTHWPLELDSPDDAAAGSTAIPRLTAANVDVIFALPSTAGDAALQAAIDANLIVATVAEPTSYRLPTTDDDLLLPMVLPDVTDTLTRALTTYLDSGQLTAGHTPFDFYYNTLRLLPLTNDSLRVGQYGFVAETVAQLASGDLEIGIDITTGEPEFP